MQRRTLYILTLLELIWFAALLLSSEFGVLYLDEAWYLTASHLVFQGQVLYRDFAFTQGPVLPYVYGLALQLIGTNLAIGRFVSVGLATLALALVLNMAHRMAGPRAAILAFLLLIATPNVIYYLPLVKTYSLAAALTLWALALVLHSGSSGSSRAAFLSTLVAGLAALTRLSFLVLLVLVFVFWVWRGRGRASGLALLVPGLVTLALAATSNGNLLFDVLEFHLGQVRPERLSFGFTTTLGLGAAVAFAPALLLLLSLLGLWLGVAGFHSRLLDWWRTERATKVLFFLVATALAIAHFVSPAGAWEYQIPGYLLVVVLLGALLASVIDDVVAQPGRALVLSVLVVASSGAIWSNTFVGLWRPNSTLLSASKASRILAQRSRPGDTLLGGFNHIALASGLQIYPGNEMGMFSIADGSWPAKTTLRHFLSEQAVTEVLANCSATFVATSSAALFELSVPSLRPTSAALRDQWRALLQEKYRFIYSDQDMTIFERIVDKCGSTPSIGEGDSQGRTRSSASTDASPSDPVQAPPRRHSSQKKISLANQSPKARFTMPHHRGDSLRIETAHTREPGEQVTRLEDPDRSVRY